MAKQTGYAQIVVIVKMRQHYGVQFQPLFPECIDNRLGLTGVDNHSSLVVVNHPDIVVLECEDWLDVDVLHWNR